MYPQVPTFEDCQSQLSCLRTGEGDYREGVGGVPEGPEGNEGEGDLGGCHRDTAAAWRGRESRGEGEGQSTTVSSQSNSQCMLQFHPLPLQPTKSVPNQLAPKLTHSNLLPSTPYPSSRVQFNKVKLHVA